MIRCTRLVRLGLLVAVAAAACGQTPRDPLDAVLAEVESLAARGDARAAERALVAGIGRCDAIGDARGAARLAERRVHLLRDAGLIDSAVAAAIDAEQRLAALQQIFLAAQMRVELGSLLLTSGAPEEARAALDRLGDFFDRAGDAQYAGVVLGLRGEAAAAIGDLGAAEEYYAAAAQRFDGAGNLAGAAWQHSRVADCRVARGQSFLAIPAREEALRRMQAARGEGHADLVLLMRRLASDLEMSGAMDAAGAQYRAAVAAARRLGPDAAIVLVDALDDLGQFAMRRESMEDGVDLLAEAVNIVSEAIPGDSWLKARSMARLAEAHYATRCPDTALALNHAAAEMLTRLGETTGSETAAAHESIAACLEALGRAGEALAHRQAALDMRREIAPLGDYAAWNAASRLADAYSALGRHADALPLRIEVVASQAAHPLGPPPEHATALGELGRAQMSVGMPETALPTLQRADGLARAVRAPPPAREAILADLGWCLRAVGARCEVLEVTQEILALRRAGGAKDTAAEAAALSDVGMALLEVGDAAAALAAFEDERAVRERLQSPWESPRPTVYLDIAQCRLRIGQVGEAVGSLEHAAAIARESAAYARREQVDLLLATAREYRLAEFPLEGTALAEEALAAVRSDQPPDPALLDLCLRESVRGLLQLRQAEAATPLMEEALALARRAHPDGDAPAIADALEGLAICLIRADRGVYFQPSAARPGEILERLMLRDPQIVVGRSAEALPLLREATAMRRRLAGGRNTPEAANNLRETVMLLYQLGRAGDAIAPAAEWAAIERELTPRRSGELAMALLMHGMAYFPSGRMAEAFALIDEALATFAQDPTAAPYIDQIKDLQAMALSMSGRSAAAEPMLRDALAAARRRSPPDDVVLARALLTLGGCLSMQDRPAEVEPLAREALELLRAAPAAPPGAAPDALRLLAQSLGAQGRHEQALDVLQEELALRQRDGADRLTVAATRLALGGCLRALRRPMDALPYFRENAAMAADIPVLQADLLADLASLHLELQQPELAEPLLAEAIAAIESFRESARDLDELARSEYFESLKRSGAFDLMVETQLTMNRPDQALRYVERGRARGLLDLLERGRFDPLAQLRARASASQDEALLKRIEAARKELHTAEQKVARLEHDLAAAPRDAASIAAETDREAALQQARTVQRAATRAWFALVAEVLPISQPREPAELQSLLAPGERMLVYNVTDHGSALLVVRPPGEAIDGGTLRWWDDRPVTLESLQAAIDQYLDAILREGRAAQRPAIAARLEELAALDTPDAVQRSEQEGLKAALEGIDRSLSRVSDPDSGTDSIDSDLGWHLFLALIPPQVWDEVRGAPRVYVVPHGPLNRLPFETLILLPNETAGDRRYWLDDGPPLIYGPSGSALLWSRARRIEQRRLAPVHRPLLAAVLLGDPRFGPSGEAAQAQPPETGALLLDVARDSTAAQAGLQAGDVIVAYDSAGVDGYIDLRRLVRAASDAIEDGQRAAGAIAVAYWRRGETRTTQIDPGPLGAEVARLPPREALAGRQSGAALALAVERSGLAERFGSLAPLPGTRAEVLAIAHALRVAAVGGAEERPRGTSTPAATIGGDGASVQLLLGEAATEAALYAAAPTARFLHLATHQIADETEFATYSSLALTLPPEVSSADNGFLTLQEMLAHWADRLSRCELVVLSACETQVGRRQRDEAVYALPIGFQYAGAPSVIASLWRVNDASTALLMARFYEQLASNDGHSTVVADDVDKLAAFTAARKELRAAHPEPYFWAPFVFIGYAK